MIQYIVGGDAMPSRYKKVLDKATGKHYFYDKETKETFWTLAEGPADMPLSTTPKDPRKQRKSELPPLLCCCRYCRRCHD